MSSSNTSPRDYSRKHKREILEPWRQCHNLPPSPPSPPPNRTSPPLSPNSQIPTPPSSPFSLVQPPTHAQICLGVDLEPDEWIKDSGCSKHMTGNRKLFSTYKAYNGGNVIFGSNLRGNIIGKEDYKKFFKIKVIRKDNLKTTKRPFQRSRDDKNGKSERKCFRCGDPNHLIGECPKSPRDKNQRAFVGGSWSDSGEENDEKIQDETCLIAQAPNEVCSESSYFSDENSSIDDLALDNE
ncbi:zf-CCHC domain-containing protein [Tanacetum coccineum]